MTAAAAEDAARAAPSTSLFRHGGWMARVAASCAVLLLAACGGDASPRAAGDGTAAEAANAPAVPAPAPLDTVSGAEAEAVPAPATVPPELRRPRRPPPEPTRADSAAAARENVSPEWKQRERSMAGYADCMEQVRGVDPAMRPRLQAACSRLPDAPR